VATKLLASAALGMTLLTFAAGLAWADPSDRAAPNSPAIGQAPAALDRPWADKVSETAQKQALALFEEGNKLFETSEHAAALAKYREAMKIWDHPAIRYNAAVALINLDQPLAANENLDLALRHGAAPFSLETYQQALTYRKLLRAQLAQVTVTCAEPGAEITMDGAALFVAPGDSSRWLLPGTHQIVARKAGRLTETRDIALVAGTPATERISMKELAVPRMKTVHRWSVWKPWAVLGAGVVVGLAGVPLMLQAKSDINAYDAAVTQTCPMGCVTSTIPQSASASLDRGHRENIVAVSLFCVGGAALAGGVAMLVLNPRLVPTEDASHVAVAPVIGSGTLGFSIALRQ